jgi:hypothetical protein
MNGAVYGTYRQPPCSSRLIGVNLFYYHLEDQEIFVRRRPAPDTSIFRMTPHKDESVPRSGLGRLLIRRVQHGGQILPRDLKELKGRIHSEVVHLLRDLLLSLFHLIYGTFHQGKLNQKGREPQLMAVAFKEGRKDLRTWNIITGGHDLFPGSRI